MAQDQNKTVQDFVFDLIENSSNLTPDNQNCILAFYRKANKDFLELLKDLKLIPDNYNTLLISKGETNFYDTEYIEFKGKQDVTMFDRVFYIKTQFDIIKVNTSNINAAAQNYQNIFEILNESGENLKLLIKCYMNAPEKELFIMTSKFYSIIVNKSVYTEEEFDINIKRFEEDSKNHIGTIDGEMLKKVKELRNIRDNITNNTYKELSQLLSEFRSKYTECENHAKQCKELYSGSLKVIVRIRGGQDEGKLNVYVDSNQQIIIPENPQEYTEWIQSTKPFDKIINSTFQIKANLVSKKSFDAIINLKDNDDFKRFVFKNMEDQRIVNSFVDGSENYTNTNINTLIEMKKDNIYSPKLENNNLNILFDTDIKSQLQNSINNGWNMVVFGYGFSGSGKTYTLLGNQIIEKFENRDLRRKTTIAEYKKYKNFIITDPYRQTQNLKTLLSSNDIISMLNGITELNKDYVDKYFDDIGLTKEILTAIKDSSCESDKRYIVQILLEEYYKENSSLIKTFVSNNEFLPPLQKFFGKTFDPLPLTYYDDGIPLTKKDIMYYDETTKIFKFFEYTKKKVKKDPSGKINIYEQPPSKKLFRDNFTALFTNLQKTLNQLTQELKIDEVTTMILYNLLKTVKRDDILLEILKKYDISQEDLEQIKRKITILHYIYKHKNIVNDLLSKDILNKIKYIKEKYTNIDNYYTLWLNQLLKTANGDNKAKAFSTELYRLVREFFVAIQNILQKQQMGGRHKKKSTRMQKGGNGEGGIINQVIDYCTNNQWNVKLYSICEVCVKHLLYNEYKEKEHQYESIKRWYYVANNDHFIDVNTNDNLSIDKNKFRTLLKNIDEYRKYNFMTQKYTPNNDASSRSHLLIKLKITSENTSSIVTFIDMAGLENSEYIKSEIINTTKTVNDTIQQIFFRSAVLSKKINNLYPPNKVPEVPTYLEAISNTCKKFPISKGNYWFFPSSDGGKETPAAFTDVVPCDIKRLKDVYPSDKTKSDIIDEQSNDYIKYTTETMFYYFLNLFRYFGYINTIDQSFKQNLENYVYFILNNDSFDKNKMDSILKNQLFKDGKPTQNMIEYNDFIAQKSLTDVQKNILLIYTYLYSMLREGQYINLTLDKFIFYLEERAKIMQNLKAESETKTETEKEKIHRKAYITKMKELLEKVNNQTKSLEGELGQTYKFIGPDIVSEILDFSIPTVDDITTGLQFNEGQSNIPLKYYKQHFENVPVYDEIVTDYKNNNIVYNYNEDFSKTMQTVFVMICCIRAKPKNTVQSLYALYYASKVSSSNPTRIPGPVQGGKRKIQKPALKRKSKRSITKT